MEFLTLRAAALFKIGMDWCAFGPPTAFLGALSYVLGLHAAVALLSAARSGPSSPPVGDRHMVQLGIAFAGRRR